MKMTTVAVAGILAASFSLPAMAGPNWSVIHKSDQMAIQRQQTSHNSNTQEEVLPLDHGPRAKSTPWMNKEREMELMANKGHKKKTSVIAYHDFKKSSHS